MHRHGYKKRKLSRPRDQRRILIKNLANQLVTRHSLTTTLPKAKEVRPYVERLITKAKKGGLQNRRIVISKLSTISAAHLLVDHLSPQLQARTSGYLRIEKLENRRGDYAPMARLSFVDTLKQEAKEVATKPARKPAETSATPKEITTRAKTVEPKVNAKTKRQAQIKEKDE